MFPELSVPVEAAKAPFDGWTIDIQGDYVLVSLVDQLPTSRSIIETPQSADITKPQNSREWHGLIHKISADINERFKNKFKRGDRVLINGSATRVMISGLSFEITPATSIVAVLRHTGDDVDPVFDKVPHTKLNLGLS